MAGIYRNSSGLSKAEDVRAKFSKVSADFVVDKPANLAKEKYNLNMDTVSREELTAKLELIEAKADARMSRFEERIDQAIGEMRRDSSDLKTEIRGLRSDWESKFGGLKTTLVVTAVTSVLAIGAINVGLIQTMFGAFESGKSTALAVSQATEEIRAIRKQLDEQAKRTAEVRENSAQAQQATEPPPASN